MGGLLPVASPTQNGIVESTFMAKTTRWIEITGLKLLPIVKLSDTNWKRESFAVFGADAGTGAYFNVYGGGVKTETSGAKFSIKKVGMSSSIEFYKKNDILYLYYKGGVGDRLMSCIISTNNEVSSDSILSGINPAEDSTFELVTPTVS